MDKFRKVCQFIAHYRQKPNEESESFYPSLSLNVTERQTWVENEMYYSKNSLQFPVSSFIYSVVSRHHKIFRKKWVT